MAQRASQRGKSRPGNGTAARRIKEEEFTVYGWNACLQAFLARPDDLKRLYYHKDRAPRLKQIKDWCRKHRLPYRQLDSESLNKVAAGTHHEGVVLVMRPPRIPPVYDLLRHGLPEQGLAVALDGLGNPHNLGAILRSCAYFGVAAAILDQEEARTALTPSAARMAEGGLESAPLYVCKDLASALRDFHKAGVFVLGTDVKLAEPLYRIPIEFPCIAVLGNEQEGLSAKVRKRCQAVGYVPGKGPLESLNVSVAAGVVLAELTRRLAVEGNGI